MSLDNFCVDVSRVVFGVRYEPQYAIGDCLGKIVDSVLRSKESPFGPKTFPFSNAKQTEHRLVNDDTDNQLIINQQESILNFHINSAEVEDIKNLCSNFDNYVLRGIREKANISNINRFGFMVEFKSFGENSGETPSKVVLDQLGYNDIKFFSMSFNKHLPTEAGYAKRNVNDYRNVNYELKENEENSIVLSIDYQEYFEPGLTSKEWDKHTFTKFVDGGVNYINKEAEKWLSLFSGSSEVA